MITNYIPDMCGYGLNNLKKVVHIFSESANVIHIDNGEAYVASGITDLQTISATSVSFEEATAYDDRFKFQKTVTATVNGFAKLSTLGGKYYIVLEDVNGIMWLVNADFPSLVTYTYTLQDGTDETVFTFSALSNFPTLKLNANINNTYACQNYSLVRVDGLKILEKRYANLNASSGIVYGYSNQVYKTVRPYRNSIKVEETFDGTDANTTIQFSIGLDDYQSSWHYNMLEYPYNKYVAVIDHLACGFEMGLVPSYNVQGSHQIGGGDTVTVTLVGGSQRGSEWAESWMEVTVAPVYTWRLSDEWICKPVQYRWVESGTTCVGYDKYTNNILEASEDLGVTWFVVIPEQYSASTVIEAYSPDCGYVPPTPTISGKYELALNDSSIVTAACNSSSSITSGNVSNMYARTLVSATIGSCVNTIDVYAFRNCSGLTSIIIPNNITSIGNFSFQNCTSLSSISMSNSVTTIGRGAFKSCTGLTGIRIPNSIVTINNGTFYDCSGLTSVTIPDSVTSIDINAFNRCVNLSSLTIPDSVTSIGDNAFYHAGLTSIIIPSGITSIGVSAFRECSGLTDIELSLGLTSIDGRAAFQDCHSLTSVTIPDSLTTIGTDVFRNCTSLSSVTIPNSVTSIGNYAFYGCTGLTNINISTGVTSISDSLLRNCISLTSVTIPNGVVSIKDYAFMDSSGLTSVSIPSSVTSIGYSSFRGCKGLTSVTIPDSVTSISGSAFYDCNGLTSVTVLATTPPLIDDLIFGYFGYSDIYVPSGSVSAYKSATNWTRYKGHIKPIPGS